MDSDKEDNVDPEDGQDKLQLVSFKNRSWIEQDNDEGRWEWKLSSFKTDLSYVRAKLTDEDFLSEMLKSRKSLSEMFEGDKNFKARIANNDSLKGLVDSFSDTIDYVLESGRTRNPMIGEQSKSRADEFAETMGEHLDNVRGEGFTSTRKIAERFNELGLKSPLGKDWSFNAVARLIRRRKELGLENDGNESLTAE